MVFPTPLHPINHVLRQNSWALERLRAHAGQSVRVEHFPFVTHVVITPGGEVDTAPANTTPDVTIRITPGLGLRLMAQDPSAWNDIPVQGDAALAASLQHVARNLRWDVEEDLSRVVGDIAAHRMVESGRKLHDWGRQSAENVARSFSEYWTHEAPLITSRHEVEQFVREVDALRDDLARIEKRIEGLGR